MLEKKCHLFPLLWEKHETKSHFQYWLETGFELQQFINYFIYILFCYIEWIQQPFCGKPRKQSQMHYLAYYIIVSVVQCRNKKLKTPNQNALICFIFKEIIWILDFKSPIIVSGVKYFLFNPQNMGAGSYIQ